MLDPHGLFEVQARPLEFQRPVLVHALHGFADAGRVTALTREHILVTCPSETIVRFDVDQLLDYRGRRPEMIFHTDHWESYAEPQLAIHAVRDSAGTTFLLLSGPEPDSQWERFAAAVEIIVRQLDVRLLIGLDAIPMGVPHTRPTSVIAHGSPPGLVSDYSPWLGSVHVPASAGHLLEFRLGNAGFNSMGFAANVPYYLAHVDYPEGSAKLLECVARAGSLQLSADALVEAATSVRNAIDEQVAGAGEIAALVHRLEVQYDSIAAGRSDSLVADGTRLPTADEIGAEFEQYLARQPPPGESASD